MPNIFIVSKFNLPLLTLTVFNKQTNSLGDMDYGLSSGLSFYANISKIANINPFLFISAFSVPSSAAQV